MKTWILGTEYDTTDAKSMDRLGDVISSCGINSARQIALGLQTALIIASAKETPESKGSDSVCPVCGSYEIEGGNVEMDCNEAFQPCTCHCGASWNNTYTFNGSSEIKEG